MTGPEHYRAAEAMLINAQDAGGGKAGSAVEAYYLAVAQVHATLALAAATALASYRPNAMPVADEEAWLDAAGTDYERSEAADG